MSQGEVIQALKNLGNRATKGDLIDEYFKIHYTNPIQRMEQIASKNYKIGNYLAPYITKLRRHGIIASRLITDDPKRKRNEVEYFLLSSEHLK